MTYRELNELIRETRGRLDKLCVDPSFADEGNDVIPSPSA